MKPSPRCPLGRWIVSCGRWFISLRRRICENGLEVGGVARFRGCCAADRRRSAWATTKVILNPTLPWLQWLLALFLQMSQVVVAMLESPSAWWLVGVPTVFGCISVVVALLTMCARGPLHPTYGVMRDDLQGRRGLRCHFAWIAALLSVACSSFSQEEYATDAGTKNDRPMPSVRDGLMCLHAFWEACLILIILYAYGKECLLYIRNWRIQQGRTTILGDVVDSR